MLVVAREGRRYPDRTDPARFWRLPDALVPAVGPDGVPAVALTRSAQGGLLHLRLRAVWPELAEGERPVTFAGGRFRLLLDIPGHPDAGQWWPAAVSGATIVDRSVSLTPIEAAIAGHLGTRTQDLVDVDVELEVRGFAPSCPWLASVPRETLRSRLDALLGSTAVPWPAVERAFLGLDLETFTWHPLVPGALPPERDQALVAIAHHVAPMLMTENGTGWTLGGDGPARVDANLAVPGIATETVGFRWSFSEFLASAADPRSHVVDVDVDAPFAASVVTVANDLPLADGGLRRLAVDIKTGGPSGLLQHEFRPGAESAVQLPYVSETFDPRTIQWRTKYTIATANGPATGETAYRPGNRFLELTPETIGITPLRFAADAALFDHAVGFEISIGSRTLLLTTDKPEAWAVGRTPPLTVDVIAVLASGDRYDLGPQPIDARGLTLDASLLGQLHRLVEVTPPPDPSGLIAYLAIQVDGHAWRTLDTGAALAIPVDVPAPWVSPQVRYRSRHVARGTDDRTRPIVESDWREATGDRVVVEV